MSLTKVSYSMITGAPVNILDYGADPTGVNDSTAAFTAASATSNEIYVPAGDYKLTSAITLANTLSGSGSTSKILLSNPSAQFLVASDNISFRNINIIANATMAVAAVEVINYKAFWDITNVFCYNGTGTLYEGIKVSSGLSGVISQCRVTDATNIGIYVTYAPSAAKDANAITVANCYVRNSGVCDIMYEKGYNGAIINCVAEGTGPLRYLLKTTSAMYFSNNYAEGDGGLSTTSISYKLDGCDTSNISSYSSSAARTFWLTGNSSDNTINGAGFETNGMQYEIDAGCRENSFFYGGYVPYTKISDAGTRTTIFVNGGFAKGSSTQPGIRFTTDATTSPNTGFSCTVNSISALINGVELIRTVSSVSADETSFLALCNVGGSLIIRRFLLGAADSGGAGYRLVRIAN
jgi:hypothetical protein